MYIKYFNMDQEPFAIRPETEFFFTSPAHQQALDLLTTSIEHAEPLIFVHGEYGTGKTLTCLKLLERLSSKDRKDKSSRSNIPYLFFPSPDVTWRDVLIKLSESLGINDVSGLEDGEIKRLVFDFYTEHPESPAIYLIFDDFQDTDRSLLSHLKKTINFNVKGFFPIRIILIAHTSFLKTMQEDVSLKPFLQRFRRRIQIFPLTHDAMREYIYFRLFNAGARGRPVFSEEALALIKKESKCIPRLINNLCDAALIVAARNHRDQIDDKIIKEATALYDIRDDNVTETGTMEVPGDLEEESKESEPVSYAEVFNLSETSDNNSTYDTDDRSEGKPDSLSPENRTNGAGTAWHILIIVLVILLTAAVTYIVMQKLTTSLPHPVPAETSFEKKKTASTVKAAVKSPDVARQSPSRQSSGMQMQPVEETAPLKDGAEKATSKPAAVENYSYQYADPEPRPLATDREKHEKEMPVKIQQEESDMVDPLAGDSMIPFTSEGVDANGT